jgi:hypothetical protein
MIAQRRDDAEAASQAERRARRAILPDEAWEEARSRATAHGMEARLLDAGTTILVTAEVAQLSAVPATG